MPVPVQNIRSSVKDKVPDASKLEPGQLAVNNHHENPGLFTLAEDGTVIRLAASSVFMYL